MNLHSGCFLTFQPAFAADPVFIQQTQVYYYAPIFGSADFSGGLKMSHEYSVIFVA